MESISKDTMATERIEKLSAALRIETSAGKTVSVAAAEEMTSYSRHLLFFIFLATLFEGYDTLITSLALPYLERDFQVNLRELGFATGALSAGAVAAFVFVQLADRYGRRPLFLAVVLGYTACTVLTAFSAGVYDFVFYQFLARAFQTAEVGLGAIILTEELPTRYRGRGVTLMLSAIMLGGALAALLFPLLVQTAFGWRSLYLAGSTLIIPVAFYWKKFQESHRWLQEQEGWRSSASEHARFKHWQKIRLVFSAEHQKKLLAATILWFFSWLYAGVVILFFSYYVMNERGWNPERVGKVMALGYLVAFVGYAASGPLLDSLGRKVTASMYFILGAISATICYRAEDPLILSTFYLLTLATTGITAIAATISSEIFPTSIRATANAVANNIFGRTGNVAAPILVGILSGHLGSAGGAVSYVVWGNLICVPIIFFLLPETKNKALEEIARD